MPTVPAKYNNGTYLMAMSFYLNPFTPKAGAPYLGSAGYGTAWAIRVRRAVHGLACLVGNERTVHEMEGMSTVEVILNYADLAHRHQLDGLPRFTAYLGQRRTAIIFEASPCRNTSALTDWLHVFREGAFGSWTRHSLRPC